jgi:two-component system CheB/CheR fusion protein
MDADTSQPNELNADSLIRDGAIDFPVVGIGASAGGLQALQHFFTQMPTDTGMAFVAILHLSPSYESNMASLLQKTTTMRVTQVNEATTILPNNVYVIPPTHQLVMVDSTVRLDVQEEPRGRRAPIDVFFRTLAETQGRRAAAIVLSGSGADGAVGIKRIKEMGGVTLAQDPQEVVHSNPARPPRVATGGNQVGWAICAGQSRSAANQRAELGARLHTRHFL